MLSTESRPDAWPGPITAAGLGSKIAERVVEETAQFLIDGFSHFVT